MKDKERRAGSPRHPTSGVRSQLYSLLSEACELEHGLACSYLYSAFTLKKNVREGGLDAVALGRNRRWAAQLYYVAAEEMLHLAQAWNLLSALGGTPYFNRPNFPQQAKYYALGVEMALEPFSQRALQRFVCYERPAEMSADQCPAAGLEAGAPPRSTVGELYRRIREIIVEQDDGLFIGLRSGQVDMALVDFPNLIAIRDRTSALAAIDMITEQGEGAAADREDSHYGIFRKTLAEFDALGAQDQAAAARPSIANPRTSFEADYGAPNGAVVTDAATREVVDIFDRFYGAMLTMLAFVFTNTEADAPIVRAFSRASLDLMTRVLKPMGEAITQMPAGECHPAGATAGPAFAIRRVVALPADARVAAQVLIDRLTGLVERADAAASGPLRLEELTAAARNAREIIGERMGP